MTDFPNTKHNPQSAQLRAEIHRLTAEVGSKDENAGTARPPGQSLGALYERLGVHLVAMHNCQVHPRQIFRLIQQVAVEAREFNTSVLLALLATPTSERALYPARIDDDRAPEHQPTALKRSTDE